MTKNLSNIKRQKAVALKYNGAEDVAPKVLASGKGRLAEKILELAQEQDIAIYKDPTLVEALVQLDIGQEIPPELYQAVAEILSFIYAVDAENYPDSCSNE